MPRPSTAPGLMLSTTTSQRRARSEQQLASAVQLEVKRYALLVDIEVEVKGSALGPVEVLVLAGDGPRRTRS